MDFYWHDATRWCRKVVIVSRWIAFDIRRVPAFVGVERILRGFTKLKLTSKSFLVNGALLALRSGIAITTAAKSLASKSQRKFTK